MSGFFRLIAILFDRGVYPQCFWLSEDAFRQYIHECSYISKNSGMQFSNQRAAKKCLRFSEEKYATVKKELVKNQFVLRYYKKKGPDEKPAKKKTWGCSNPPLLKLSEVDGSLESCFFRPKCEPQSGLSAMFHHGKTAFEFLCVPQELVHIKGCREMKSAICPLATMSVDEIYCYFNLLCQNRESWFGVNPNYVRYELSLVRDIVHKFDNLGACLFPAEEYGDSLQINPVLTEKTGMSKDKLKEIINSLVRQGFFEWRYWIAQRTTYSEKRRSLKVSQLKYRYYLDWQQIEGTTSGLMGRITDIVESNPQFKLIAQLRSCLKMNAEFESLCNLNCAHHGLSKHLQSQNRKEIPRSEEINTPSDNHIPKSELETSCDNIGSDGMSKAQRFGLRKEEIIAEIAKDLNLNDEGYEI